MPALPTQALSSCTPLAAGVRAAACVTKDTAGHHPASCSITARPRAGGSTELRALEAAVAFP